jgi:hypothetical protein
MGVRELLKFMEKLVSWGEVREHFRDIYSKLDDLEELLIVAYEDEKVLSSADYGYLRDKFEEIKNVILRYERMFGELVDFLRGLAKEEEEKWRAGGGRVKKGV